jgi:hypothetical protein
MLDPTSSNAPSTMIRHLSVCHNNNPLETEKCNVLLVEPPMIPRSDRERLLSAANYCVTAVRDVREIFLLRFETPVAFAVLNDSLGPVGLRAASESVRRQWPLAKIVIIGCAVPTLEDHLYDEAISHRVEETSFLNVLQMLTSNSGHYRRPAVSTNESDPTKNLRRDPAPANSSFEVPGGLYRMRATG